MCLFWKGGEQFFGVYALLCQASTSSMLSTEVVLTVSV